MKPILTTTLALLLSSAVCTQAADGHDHGKAVEAGGLTLGGSTIDVDLSGAATAGSHVHLGLHLTPAVPAPKAVRVWIGSKNGRGSTKAKAEAETGHPGGYEAHVEVPSPLPEGSRIWVSIEPAAGEALKGSLPLPGPDAKAHDHRK